VRAKLSNKNRIAVLAEVRKKLRVRSGDYPLVDIRDDSMVVVPEPDRYSRRLWGLHAEIWQDDDTGAYVQKQREAWNG
jgi:bifunctional DNA-binding transcriptional regulator/antitoxin component of YhaV-PrlF toxin-antitoxin module